MRLQSLKMDVGGVDLSGIKTSLRYLRVSREIVLWIMSCLFVKEKHPGACRDKLYLLLLLLLLSFLNRSVVL
jgi:hypothetical protein